MSKKPGNLWIQGYFKFNLISKAILVTQEKSQNMCYAKYENKWLKSV